MSGEKEFIMLDFGDGTEMTAEKENDLVQRQLSSREKFNELFEKKAPAPIVENQVSLEPQVSQAQLLGKSINASASTGGMQSPVAAEPLPAQFIAIDFDAIEPVKLDSKENTVTKPSPQFIDIDFGNGLDIEQPRQDNPISGPRFMEFTFDEEPVLQGPTQTTIQTPVAHAAAPASPPPFEPSPANTVLFFVPGCEEGLLIYNQSPTGMEAKLTGYLPEGKFHASGMEPVRFDPAKHSEEFELVRTPNGAYVQQVIMVDERTLMKIALQGIYPQHPEDERKRQYFIVDLHDEVRDVRRELIQATYEEDQLHPKQREVFDVMREVGKTDEGKRVIGDIITGSVRKTV